MEQTAREINQSYYAYERIHGPLRHQHHTYKVDERKKPMQDKKEVDNDNR